MSSALVNLRVHSLWNDLRVLTEAHDLLERLYNSASVEQWSGFITDITNSEEEYINLFADLDEMFRGSDRVQLNP